MDLGSQVFIFVSVTILAIAISFGLLAITKIPAVVVLLSAVLTAGLYMGYARVIGAHWDTVAVVALFTVLVYASVISLAFVGIGRLLRWSTFLEDRKDR